jgi:hypothetical protein
MNGPALALTPVLTASTGTGASPGTASSLSHRNHAVREHRMETGRAGNRGASRAVPGSGAPLFPLFFHPPPIGSTRPGDAYEHSGSGIGPGLGR